MNDLLPSASLILAVIALLFNSWKDEIQEAREVPIELHYEESEKDHKKVKEALWKRSFPLALSATIMLIIFIPEIVWHIKQSIKVVKFVGLANSFSYYNAKAATFIFIYILFIAFGYYLWSLTIEIYKRNKEFEEKRLLDLTKE